MIKNNKKEDLIRHNLKSRYDLKKLLNHFKLSTEPQDDIKDVKLSSINLKSYDGDYHLTLKIANSNIKISDIIKINDLVVREVELNVIFHNNEPVLVKLKSFDDKNKPSPIIKKYLHYWGLTPLLVN